MFNFAVDFYSIHCDMKAKLLTLILIPLAFTYAAAGNTVELNGAWQFRFDKDVALEQACDPAFEANDVMTVPGCFDVLEQYAKQRGTAQYRKVVYIHENVSNAVWQIEGMGLRGRFFIDGRKVGESSLAYSCIEFETGPLSAGEHTFAAALDNNLINDKDELFLPYYDFYAFGGFYHGMTLTLQKQKVQLDKVLVRTRDFRSGVVELELETLCGASLPATVSAAVQFDAGAWSNVKFTDGKASLKVPDFKLWSPAHPNLHTVRVKYQGSLAQARFGIRSIEVSGSDILLNGESIYLKGVNRHESHPSFGSATPEQVMINDIHLMKSLGINFVRGSHYTQSQRFLDLCDEAGLLVWEESLGWGNRPEQLGNPAFIEKAKEQTRLMVRRSMNHPSVIIFAFLNEMKSHTPEGKEIADILIKVIREQDSGRLVSFACNSVKTDISNVNTDIISFNTYPVWIDKNPMPDSSPETMRRIIQNNFDEIVRYFRGKYGDKPIIISESGTCGIYGYRDNTAAQWTEDFQAEYVGHAMDAAFSNKEIKGFTIWHFADADSYHRSGGVLRTKPFAQNLAGLYDPYRRPKKVTEVVREKFSSK